MKSIIVILIIFFSFTYSQSVEIKDSADETLMIVNDEGEDKSSITVQNSLSAPTITDNKLYNESGTLKWNGTILATASSLWTLNGGNVYRSSGNVGIGTSNPLSQLSVGSDGSSNVAIYGTHNSTGIKGEALVGSGATGVIGTSLSSSGIGVSGANFSPTGITYGVYGHVDSQDDGWAGYFGGRGYFSGNVGIGSTNPLSKLSVSSDGDANATIFGRAWSDIAIYGEAANPSAGNYGGYFEAQGTSGRGVYGYASHASGVNYGVRGKTESPNGYAGYFEGRGYFSGNVGIGTTNPNEMLTVHGYLEAADGLIHNKFASTIVTFSHKDWSHGFSQNDIGNTYIHPGDLSIGAIYFRSGGNTNRMTIASTGNVGIGTTTPDEIFEVEFDSNTDIELGQGTSDTDVTFITLRSPNGTKYYVTVDDSGNMVTSTTKP